MEVLKKLLSPLVQWRYSPKCKPFLPATLKIFKGFDRLKRQPLSFAFYGDQFQTSRTFWAEKLLEEGFNETDCGKMWMWKVGHTIRKNAPECAAVIFESDVFLTKMCTRLKGFRMPRSMQMHIDISRPLDEFDLNKRSAFHNAKRRIEKNRLSLEETKDPKVFDEFYHHMYTPYVKKKYSNSAYIHSHRTARKFFDRSLLYLIRQDDQVIAGGVTEITDESAKFHFVGVKDGNHDYVRQGALAALNVLRIINLKEKGVKRVNMGGTRPLLTDPLTLSKKSLMAQVSPEEYDPKDYIRLVLLKRQENLVHFLSQNPFVFITKKLKPRRAFFAVEDQFSSKKNFLNALEATDFSGLEKTILYCSKDDDVIKAWVDEAGLESLEIKSIDQPFPSG